MNRIERMSLEQNWKVVIQNLRNRGINESFAWIMSGKEFVDTYNRGREYDYEHIRFVCHVTDGE